MSIGIVEAKTLHDTRLPRLHDAVMSVGARILARRKALDLSQAELSARSGIAQGTISRYENAEGNKKPRYDAASLAAIAKALEVTAQFLQTGMDPASAAADTSDPFENARRFWTSIQLGREDTPETLAHIAAVTEALRNKRNMGATHDDRRWLQEFDDMDRDLLRAANPLRRKQMGTRKMTDEDL